MKFKKCLRGNSLKRTDAWHKQEIRNDFHQMLYKNLNLTEIAKYKIVFGTSQVLKFIG